MMGSTGYNQSTTKQKKGLWTPEEDLLLIRYIQAHGEGHWRTLPLKAGLQRCGKGCRLRWMNYLRPNIKRGNISLDEEDLIIRLHKLLGNRWSLIAGRVPGRTDNEIKNYWACHLSKKRRCHAIPPTPRHYKQPPSFVDLKEMKHLQAISGVQLECDKVEFLLENPRGESLYSCALDFTNSKVFNEENNLFNHTMNSLSTQQYSHERNLINSNHSNVGDITNYQSDTKNHMTWAYQTCFRPAIDGSVTCLPECHIANSSEDDQCNEIYYVSDDLGVGQLGEIEASRQQQQDLSCVENGYEFDLRPGRQYSSPSVCAGGNIDDDAHHDGYKDLQDSSQLLSYDELFSTLFDESTTIGFSDDIQGMQTISGWDDVLWRSEYD